MSGTTLFDEIMIRIGTVYYSVVSVDYKIFPINTELITRVNSE